MANTALYPVTQISDQLVTAGGQSQVDLGTMFYNNTGSDIVFSISEISSPDVCSFSFDGNIMTVTGGASIGQTNVVLKASAGSNESFLKFAVEVHDPTMVETVSEDFETAWLPDGWSLKTGTTGAGFVRSNNAHSGSYSAAHMDNTGVQNDWLVTPKFQVEDGAKLVFWQKGLYTSYYDSHNIAWSTDGNRFTTLIADLPTSEEWEKVYIDLSSQTGKEIFIGFNYQGDYADVWLIDDVQVLTPSTGIEEDVNVAAGVELYQNYPNPFNPSTEIKFSLDRSGEVKLTVLNTKGETVAEIYSGELEKGIHKFSFNAGELNSGVYFATLQTEYGTASKRMLLLK